MIRLALLSAHYRQPLNWSDQTIIYARNLYKKLLSVISMVDAKARPLDDADSHTKEIQDILSDDLNTPEAINYLSRLSKTARNDFEARVKLIHSMKFIGLSPINEKTANLFSDAEEIEQIEALVKKRNEYRIKKDFKNADVVRDKLLSMGIELEDSDGDTTWNYLQD